MQASFASVVAGSPFAAAEAGLDREQEVEKLLREEYEQGLETVKDLKAAGAAEEVWGPIQARMVKLGSRLDTMAKAKEANPPAAPEAGPGDAKQQRAARIQHQLALLRGEDGQPEGGAKGEAAVPQVVLPDAAVAEDPAATPRPGDDKASDTETELQQMLLRTTTLLGAESEAAKALGKQLQHLQAGRKPGGASAGKKGSSTSTKPLELRLAAQGRRVASWQSKLVKQQDKVAAAQETLARAVVDLQEAEERLGVVRARVESEQQAHRELAREVLP